MKTSRPDDPASAKRPGRSGAYGAARAVKAMVHDAVDATVELVREGNESAARSVRLVAGPVPGVGEAVRRVDDVRHVTTAGVLGSIKAINHLVAWGSDSVLDLMEGPRDPAHRHDDEAPWLADAARGVLNAAVGDYLRATHNDLDLSMQLRLGDRLLDLDDPATLWEEALAGVSGHVMVFVHGLGATDRSWFMGSTHYYGDANTNIGVELAGALQATVLYVRYNTGCGIEENGEACARLLEKMVKSAPGVSRLTLVGHSMGGLVLRNACCSAQQDGLSWGALVREVFYLGSPHQGAPLAAFGEVLTDALSGIDLPATRVIGQILAGRSVGTKELAQGMSWARRVELPLASQTTHHFVMGTITANPDDASSSLLGDLLVRTESASGSQAISSSIEKTTRHHRQLVHHQLQNHPEVCALILDALQAGEGSA